MNTKRIRLRWSNDLKKSQGTVIATSVNNCHYFLPFRETAVLLVSVAHTLKMQPELYNIYKIII